MSDIVNAVQVLVAFFVVHVLTTATDYLERVVFEEELHAWSKNNKKNLNIQPSLFYKGSTYATNFFLIATVSSLDIFSSLFSMVHVPPFFLFAKYYFSHKTTKFI
jgi:hypothetical protein